MELVLAETVGKDNEFLNSNARICSRIRCAVCSMAFSSLANIFLIVSSPEYVLKSVLL